MANLLIEGNNFPSATIFRLLLAYILRIFSKSLFTVPEIFPKSLIAIILVFVLIVWLQREKQHSLHIESLKIPRQVVWEFLFTVNNDNFSLRWHSNSLFIFNFEF
jgi:MFS superfamily sulfate permease-like transporter